jgi:uncharacterized lipoprotein
MARSISRMVCRALVSTAAGVSLAGCHHALQRWFHGKPCNKPQMYVSAQSVAPLKVPAGIDAPDTRSALKIPPLNEPAPPPRKPTDQCLDVPPLFGAPLGAPVRPTNAVPST